MIVLFKKHIVVNYVILLIAIFFLGSILVLTINISLSASLKKIERQRQNQEIKNLICQDIITNLDKLENSFFKIFITTSDQMVDSEFKNYETCLSNIEADLKLLKEGGAYNRQILLNLEDIDDYYKEAPFVARHNKTVPFEYIEIAPKLVLAKDIAIKLKKLINERNSLKPTTRAFADIWKSMLIHAKHAPPLFLRMHENANAIFYKSQKEFEEIDNLVKKTKKKYFLAEILIVSIIMALFIIISIIIIRNILKILLKQKKTQEKMAAEEKKLSTIMNSVQAGIVLIDEKNHTFIDVNPKAAEMFGASKEDIIGKGCHSHICPVNDGICAISDLKQQIHNAERVIGCNNDSKKNILKSATKVNINGKSIIVETFVDITKTKQAEGKIKQKSLELEKQFEKSEKQRKAGMVVLKDLNKATKKLKTEISERKLAQKSLQETDEKLRTLNTKLKDKVKQEVAKSREKDRVMLIQSKQAAMGEMIGNIAHQWRQPLNEIGLYVQNLEDIYEFEGLTAKNLKETVDKTMDKLEYMSQTIDDFRNFFRSDKAKIRFFLKDSIDKTLSLAEAGFKNNYIKINLYLQENIYITGYPNEFSQVVLNILNNAKDILVEWKIEGPQVTINLSRQGKKVILTISDNAGGIGEDIIDKIFEPYFTTRDQITGTGLGLHISKTIIERNMMGSLTVRNIKDGAEFKIEFKTDL